MRRAAIQVRSSEIRATSVVAISSLRSTDPRKRSGRAFALGRGPRHEVNLGRRSIGPSNRLHRHALERKGHAGLDARAHGTCLDRNHAVGEAGGHAVPRNLGPGRVEESALGIEDEDAGVGTDPRRGRGHFARSAALSVEAAAIRSNEANAAPCSRTRSTVLNRSNSCRALCRAERPTAMTAAVASKPTAISSLVWMLEITGRRQEIPDAMGGKHVLRLASRFDLPPQVRDVDVHRAIESVVSGPKARASSSSRVKTRPGDRRGSRGVCIPWR